MKNVLSRVIRRTRESVAIAAFGAALLQKVKIFSTLLVRNNNSAFPLTFHFSHNRAAFTLTFLSHADLMLFHEIFAGHPYKTQPALVPEYIIDLGANIGISTLYLHTCYPKAKIVAVEANPGLIVRLKETVRGLDTITVLPCAVAGTDGTVDFYIDEEHPLGSSLLAREGARKKVSINAHSLKSIQEKAEFPRIDLVKFDIEGAEWEVFKQYPNRNKIGAMVGEVHEDLMGASKTDFEALWPSMKLRLVPTKKQGRFNIYGIHT